jgi:hypothetical protein
MILFEALSMPSRPDLTFTITNFVLDDMLDAYMQLGSSHVTAGIFQALNARCTGFTLLPLGSMAPAQQSIWVVMMYISVPSYLLLSVIVFSYPHPREDVPDPICNQMHWGVSD